MSSTVDRDAIERTIQRLFSTRQTSVLTILGLLGLLVGMVFAFLDVTTGSGALEASCGSVFSPIQEISGPTAQCGQSLSVAAIRAATLVLGGVGLVAHSLLNKGFNRALLILAFTLIVGLLLNFFEPSGSWVDFLFMAYAVVFAVVTWRRGMAR